MQSGTQAKAVLLEKVIETLQTRVSGDRGQQIERFVRQYYHGSSAEDLAESDPTDLFGAAMGSWNFIQIRHAGTDKVRVFNPRVEMDGWSSPHTVVEVSTEDRPFLVASVTAALARRDRIVWRVFHPIVRVRRDAESRLETLFPTGGADFDSVAESVMHFEIDHEADEAEHDVIAAQVKQVLADVRLAVEDWTAMRRKLNDYTEELIRTTPEGSRDDLDEAVAFLRWLADNHYTFLGYREAVLVDTPGGQKLETVAESGLGVLRDPDRHVLVENAEEATELPQKLIDQLHQPGVLFITKADKRSTVHRPVHMDLIRVKRFDETGRVIGGWGFAGLFTSGAYTRNVRDIPILRRKTQRVFERSGFAPDSHTGRAFTNVLETYPRDELFQIDEDALLENALAMMHLESRPRIRLLARRDIYERFMSCLVFLPRDRYDSDLKIKAIEVLEQAFDGQVSLTYTSIGDSPLAKLQAIVKTRPGHIPAYDLDEIERLLIEAARRWADAFHDALIAYFPDHAATRLWQAYGDAFPGSYRERTAPETAVHDVEKLEMLLADGGPTLNLYRLPEAENNRFGFKVYSMHDLVLSDVLPVLENMGFRVIDDYPHQLHPMGEHETLWINDFVVQETGKEQADLRQFRDKFHDAFAAVLDGRADNDGFNALVALAGLSWREVAILRTYAKYLHQIGIPFSQAYLQRTLRSHAGLAKQMIALFHARFDPGQEGKADEAAIIQTIETDLDAVANLDEDRILRRFLNLVCATIRTNVYQTEAHGVPKPTIAVKIDSHAVTEMPLPRPLYEIFVYSPRMEGIHLRGGKVARGGIRWSDRPEDFRTEILGLQKAQMVKNAVIVPVGSKGGFIAKRLPAGGDREAVGREVVACYSALMNGMLDITDNVVGTEIVPPPSVRRHDGDDPYLVVAADKGTATFSDIANGIAHERGFWLDDAFASGGSAGYDHKKMAITARGAWEAVKRHFREMGTDIQTTPFTVIGVGDMSGDVFGNGMLLSPCIRLIGAFNHRHIFIDPDPDPATSFAERKRLFDLPRSSWSDYDAALISSGGGVFDRSAKSIPLSPEMRSLFEISAVSVTPNELIQSMLRAQVDLLWNGGIGTYVKSHGQSNAEVGDKANDAVRIDGRQLRCKVVGEGGNLGLTQLGRIEAAQSGVRLNTDAIDNSAGVDCSDHEVNIKILLGSIIRDGGMTRVQRDTLLGEMTEQVASLVLRDNYLQTFAISATEARGVGLLDREARMMQELEKAGKLNRAVEFLPDDETVAERRTARVGLMRPELSVLLSYAKMTLYPELLDSDLPDDPYLESDLVGYFPIQLRERYPDQIAAHPLKREIIATVVTNSLINRTSLTFPRLAREETGQDAPSVARAFVIARDAFAVREVWAEIEALDNQVSTAVQLDMVQESRRLIESASLWFLRNLQSPVDCATTVGRFAPGIGELAANLDDAMTEAGVERRSARAEALREAGVPETLAVRVAGFDALASACDIVQIAANRDIPIVPAALTYFDLGARVRLDWLRAAAYRIPTETHWQRQAVRAIVDDLFAQQRALTTHVIAEANGKAGNGAVESWAEQSAEMLRRNEHVLADLDAAGTPDLAMLAVASRQLRGLVPD